MEGKKAGQNAPAANAVRSTELNETTMKSVFNTKSQAVRHAAGCVAQFWLKSADEIIARGGTPAAISKKDSLGTIYGVKLAQAEMDRDIYNRFRHWMHSEEIFSYAKQEARERLVRGEFPRVAAFDFKPQLNKENSEIVIAPPTPVTAHDKLTWAYDAVNKAIDGMNQAVCDTPTWSRLQDCRRSIREAMQMLRDEKK